MNLTTKERVKILLEIAASDTTHDALLDQIIASLSVDAERVMNRLVKEEERTAQLNVDPGQQRFFLRAFPVKSGAGVEIKNDSARKFSSVAAFVDDEYYLDLETGELQVDRRTVVAGPGTLQVRYTGGMGTNTADFISRFPDVAQAVELQTSVVFKRKEQYGLTSFSAEGGSLSLVPMLAWVSGAREVLMRRAAVRMGSH